MKSVEDLDVFKLAHQLALKTYAVTKTFPREEIIQLGGPDAAGVNGKRKGKPRKAPLLFRSQSKR